MQSIRYYLERSAFLRNDPSPRKGLLQMVAENVWLTVRQREFSLPNYVAKRLYRSDKTNIFDYVTSREFLAMTNSRLIHDPELSSILRNKLLFQQVASRAGIRVPRLIAYKVGNRLEYTSTKEFSTFEEFRSLLLEIIEMEGCEVFCKTAITQGGANAQALNKDSKDAEFQEAMNCSVLIIQERLENHPEISRIYPHALNTLRMETYIKRDGQIEVISGLIRFGANGHRVDNASSGGFFVHIDVDTGIINGVGEQLLKYGGRVFPVHPDTNANFAGVKIPCFDEAKALVKMAAQVIPDRYVGWDVAITPMGPVIIEGNDDPSIFMADIAYGGYKKNALFREALREATRQ